ncbi:MAG: hypothetical protein PVG39_24180 [Desulfobacteraceae bacterium]|jgi:hypothetical protein
MKVNGLPNYIKVRFLGHITNPMRGNCPSDCKGTRQEWVVQFFGNYYVGQFCPIHGWVVHRTSPVYKSFEELKLALNIT